MRDNIFTAIMLVCSVIALRRPVFGVLMFTWMGFFNPQSYVWESFPYAQMIALSTIVGYIFSSETKKFPNQREAWLLFSLWGVYGFSTVFAFYPDFAMVGLKQISKILLMVFLTLFLINTRDRLLWLVRVISLSIGFYAFKGGVFAIATGGNEMVWGPTNSFLHANNMIGMAIAMNVPLLHFLIKHDSRAWLCWVMKVMLIFSYPATIFTFSRGAWLGLGAVTALMVTRNRYRFPIILGSAIFVFTVLPYLDQLTPTRLSDRVDSLENYQDDGSAQSRFGSWAYCRRVGLSNPLTGGGFSHNTTESYQKYAPEFHERWGDYGLHPACHNMWFTVLSDHGVVGLMVWLALMGAVIRSLWRIRTLTMGQPSLSWMFDLAGGLQMAIAGFALVGTFIDAPYFDMYYYLVAAAIILKELAQKVSNESFSTANVMVVQQPRQVIFKSPVPS